MDYYKVNNLACITQEQAEQFYEMYKLNLNDYSVQLELFVNYPKILVRRAPDKNEILESMEDLIWLTYWISKEY